MKTLLINNKRYYVFNVDENKLNYSQRNNQFKWSYKEAFVKSSTECNVTSIAMALDYAGYIFPEGDFEQPEDNLAASIMKSQLVEEEYKKRYPALYEAYKAGKKDAYTPNEIHKLLEIGTNEWLGRDVDTFYENYPIVDLRKELVFNVSPVVTSCLAPNGVDANGKQKYLNHIVCITGVAYSEDSYKKALSSNTDIWTMTPDFWFIDDPWGYTLNYSSGKSGNDVVVSNERFLTLVKPIGNNIAKYAHIFKKPVATV